MKVILCLQEMLVFYKAERPLKTQCLKIAYSLSRRWRMNLSRDELDYSVYYFLICIFGSWGSWSSKHWKTSWDFLFFFFPNRVLTWRIAKLTSHSCHSTYKAENLFAALSQGNMYLEIFRNTLNFFKPLLSGKMSCYYGGRGQFVWLIHKYVTLTQLSRMIFNKGSSILLEEHSTTLSLHWYFISRVL